MVYYRKYRPQNLEELIGQEQIVQTLQKAYSQQRLAQAYLFCGPKGTGKTSTARILAKMVNCPKGGTDNCEICQSIADGSNMDLIEIDAASNRGIDDIRDIREKIKLTPSSSVKKVYIIDEVHMLSNEAFNALLKTLEEPPAHVLFILATTEVHKIPDTILSRVQKLDFKTATVAKLTEALKKVVDGEKLKVDDEVLQLIAKQSNGSFRDGIKLLDQLSSIDKTVTVKMIEEILNSSDFNHQVNLLSAIVKKDASSALKLVSKQVELGVNIKEYILSSMELIRQMVFIKHNLGSSIKEDLGSDKYQKLATLAEQFDLKQLLKVIDYFQKALEKMRVASIPSLPLEVAVIESSEVRSKNEELSVYKEEAPTTVILASNTRPESKILEAPVSQDDTVRKDDVVTPTGSSADLTTLKDKWNYILETIKPHNYSLEAMLKLVTILDCTDIQLTLEVPYAFHQRILEAPKSRTLLESVLTDVLGRPIKVATVLGKRPVEREELANIEVAADDEVIRIAAEIFNSEPVN